MAPDNLSDCFCNYANCGQPVAALTVFNAEGEPTIWVGRSIFNYGIFSIWRSLGLLLGVLSIRETQSKSKIYDQNDGDLRTIGINLVQNESGHAELALPHTYNNA